MTEQQVRDQRWYERLLFEEPDWKRYPSLYSGEQYTHINGDITFLGFLSVLLGGVAVLVAGTLLIVRQLDHHYAKEACGNWAELTDRKAQWMDLSFVSYDCYVEVDGRWMPKDSVLDLEGRRLNIHLEGES